MRLHAAVPRRGNDARFRLSLALLVWLFPLALYAQSLTIVSGNNQTLVPTQPSQPLVVRATDAQGAPLAGAAIEWSSSNATAAFAATTTTDSKGESSNRLTAILPGNYTLNARIADVQGGGSVNFVFVNGVANVGALTPVQAAVGHAIDVACPALATSPTPISSQQSDFLKRCSEIVVGATSSAVPNALDAMANNKTQPQSQMATNVQSSQATNLDARMNALRFGATGISLGGLAIASDGKALPLAMFGDTFHKDPGQGGEVGGDFSRWGFFVNGMYNQGSFAANQSRPGFDYSGASITAGLDYRFSDTF
ncbi:MAG TPA: Ig-like domain-containing protein, partial [Rudaea sp.]|nr:Ig-like domain-containing protein [Rudaea sp.]